MFSRHSHVGTVTNGHETPKVESELLASEPQLQGAVGNGLGARNEGLFEVEPIGVDRRQHRLPGCKIALNLHEHLDLRSDVKVRSLKVDHQKCAIFGTQDGQSK